MVADLIRPSLLEFIRKKFPGLDGKAFICFDDLGKFRKDYIKEFCKTRSANFPRSTTK
jgi:hypothetical protein